MRKDTTGWIVRTEKNGRHRYWKVGAGEPAEATAMAATAAGSDSAHAVTRLGTFDTARYAPTQGVAIEFEWEVHPLPHEAKASDVKAHIGSCETILGELTFDIVVEEAGVTHVEGCYRLAGGNWQVYYLTNCDAGGLPLHVPFINNKAVFSSGLIGVTGYFPADWLLNKESIGRILADAVGVNGWVEVIGPDSLLLK